MMNTTNTMEEAAQLSQDMTVAELMLLIQKTRDRFASGEGQTTDDDRKEIVDEMDLTMRVIINLLLSTNTVQIPQN